MGDSDDRVAISFWGVRGSTPCANNEYMEYGGNTTCLQIHIPHSDEVLILDSGTGIRKLGNKLQKKPGKVRGRIFITHPHWDHIQGFPFFKPIYGSKNQFDIHMPAQDGRECKEILAGHLTKTFFPVTLEMIDAHLGYKTQQPGKKKYQGYSVDLMMANHTTDTAIYKIYVKGYTIVFCPDNELNHDKIRKGDDFNSRFISFCKGADILIHDGQYNLKSYNSKRGWGHSAWEVAVDIARQAEVKNLYIVHHDPDSTDRKLNQLNEKLKTNFSGPFDSVQLAKEGEKVIL